MSKNLFKNLHKIWFTLVQLFFKSPIVSYFNIWQASINCQCNQNSCQFLMDKWKSYENWVCKSHRCIFFSSSAFKSNWNIPYTLSSYSDLSSILHIIIHFAFSTCSLATAQTQVITDIQSIFGSVRSSRSHNLRLSCIQS